MTNVFKLNDGAKGFLCCQVCRSQSLHPIKVTIFEQTKKAVGKISIRVDESTIKFGNDIDFLDNDDPRLRLAVHLTCQDCSFAAELIAREPKSGAGYIWTWRMEEPGPLVSYWDVPFDEPPSRHCEMPENGDET
jgi:hypothetical protein